MKALVKSKFGHQNNQARIKAQYGYLKAIFFSFFSPSLYRDIAKNWRGFGFIYIFMISLVLAFPWAMNQGLKLSHYYDQTVLPTIKKLPKLEVKSGEIIFNKASPFIIRNLYGVPSIILDNDTPTERLIQHYHNAFLIIHQREFTLNFPNMRPQTHKFSTDVDIVIRPEYIQHIILKTKKILLQTMYPTMVTSLFVIYMFFVFFLNLIVPFLARVFLDYRIKFKLSYRVVSVSSTPSLVFILVCHMLGLSSHYYALAGFVILYGYYMFAIYSLKNVAKELQIVS